MAGAFSSVKPRRIHESIIDQILGLLRSGKLKPGDALPSERELAEILGVSRPTVRNALCVLDAIGIVDIHHGRRTYLATPRPAVLAGPLAFMFSETSETFKQVMEFREILEPAIASRAALASTADHLDSLKQIIREQEDEVRSGGTGVEWDLMFHTAISEATGNHLLTQLMRFSLVFTKEVRSRFFQRQARGTVSIVGHRQILRALNQRDPSAASEAMLKHLREIEGVIAGQQ